MNGELAQAAALVAHGNAWLSGDQAARTDIADFENRNSTFQYVRSVAFRDDSAQEPRHTVEGWLQSVAEGRFDRLSLIAGAASAHIPFINQGLWGIVANGPNIVEAWYGQWGVNRDGVESADPKPRIWQIEYRGYRRNGGFEVESKGLADRVAELRSSLQEAIKFARTDDALVTWIPWFEQAIALATSEHPEIEYHPDMLPDRGYDLAARRLLAMGARAWCFGAMGSWNDIGFSDAGQQEKYDAVTDRLFGAVVDAVRDAVNAYRTGAQ